MRLKRISLFLFFCHHAFAASDHVPERVAKQEVEKALLGNDRKQFEARALELFRRDPQRYIVCLIDLLAAHKQNESAKQRIFSELADKRRNLIEALPSLLEITRDPEFNKNRWAIAQIVAHIGTDALPTIRTALESKEKTGHELALCCAYLIISDYRCSLDSRNLNSFSAFESMVPALTRLMSSETENVCEYATKLIGLIGIGNREINTQLARLAHDKNERIRRAVAGTCLRFSKKKICDLAVIGVLVKDNDTLVIHDTVSCITELATSDLFFDRLRVIVFAFESEGVQTEAIRARKMSSVAQQGDCPTK